MHGHGRCHPIAKRMAQIVWADIDEPRMRCVLLDQMAKCALCERLAGFFRGEERVVSVWGDPCTLTGNLSGRSVPPCCGTDAARPSSRNTSREEVVYAAHYYPCPAPRDDRAASRGRESARQMPRPCSSTPTPSASSGGSTNSTAGPACTFAHQGPLAVARWARRVRASSTCCCGSSVSIAASSSISCGWS